MIFQERPFEYTKVYSILSKLKFNLCFNLIVGNNDTIETLNISWNGFGPNGAKAIAKGLEVFRLLIFMSIKNMTQILNRHRNFFYMIVTDPFFCSGKFLSEGFGCIMERIRRRWVGDDCVSNIS